MYWALGIQRKIRLIPSFIQQMLIEPIMCQAQRYALRIEIRKVHSFIHLSIQHMPRTGCVPGSVLGHRDEQAGPTLNCSQ